jgi:hypothetical protein
MSTQTKHTTLYSTLLISSGNEANRSDLAIGQNISVIIGITIASIISIILVLYAVFKYRSRDEGTYTIDERKNLGPFAEYDKNSVENKTTSCMCKKKKSKSKQDIYQNVSKEWFV